VVRTTHKAQSEKEIISILENSLFFDGVTIKVEGFLIYTENYVHVAQDYESYKNTSTSIQIIEPNFSEKVELSSAPPAGGGVSLYPYDVLGI
jgi:hypothetical protein